MKKPRVYTREDDGTVWTRIEGLYTRPATAEELEGYCLDLGDAAGRDSDDAGRPVEGDRVPVAA
ncbi:MAG: hypothetical protein ACE1Y3_09410 [Rhodospirillales bacterium]|jgi:hypothetical protein|nr:hypothetical protein [Alphaproteobacteria bacterium]